MSAELLERARHLAGLRQDELAALAALAGTSRMTISAYEHGRKSPTLATATRLLDTAGSAFCLHAASRRWPRA